MQLYDVTFRPKGKGESFTACGVRAKDKDEAFAWAYNVQISAGWPAEKPGYDAVFQESKEAEEAEEEEE